jgi:hypothetical protein
VKIVKNGTQYYYLPVQKLTESPGLTIKSASDEITNKIAFDKIQFNDLQPLLCITLQNVL